MEKWSIEEMNILKEYYPSGNIDIIKEKLPMRTYTSITSKARKMGLKTREYWSKEEIDILRKYYSVKSVFEICEMLPHRSKYCIVKKANTLGILNSVKFQKDEIQFIIENWKTMSDKEMGLLLNRNPGGIQNKRLSMGLSRYDEKASTYGLIDYIRGNNSQWKKDSMEKCNYKCVISNKRFEDIHHLYGFNLIFNEMIKEYNIPIYDNISLYNSDDLLEILNAFYTVQSRYPLGVCLTHKIHNEFHELYGFGNNTIDQWNNFKEKYNTINN